MEPRAGWLGRKGFVGGIKDAVQGLFYGLLSGVAVLGIGGRLVMRGIAMIGGEQPGISLGGTLDILGYGGLLGATAGVFYSLGANHLPLRSTLKGPLFGLVVYGTVIVLPGDAKKAAFGFPELLSVTLMLFAALFIAYGFVLSSMLRR